MEAVIEKLRAKTTAELESLVIEGRAICTCCLRSKRDIPCSETCSVPPVYAMAVSILRERREKEE